MDLPGSGFPEFFMRILHVILTSGMAGSERYCADLANLQSAQGHEVFVAGVNGGPIMEALSTAVTFHGVHHRFFRRFGLQRLIAGLAPDICHGHLSAACKALAVTSGGIPAVATLHVGYKEHQHGRLAGLICVNHSQAKKLAAYPGLSCTIPIGSCRR